MLCEKCSNIYFKPLRDWGIPEERIRESGNVPNDFGEELYYFHHENKEALGLSVHEGCHFCTQIWASLFEDRYRWNDKPGEECTGKAVYLKRVHLYPKSGQVTARKAWLSEVWPSFCWNEKTLHSFLVSCEGWGVFSDNETCFPKTLERMFGALTNYQVLDHADERELPLENMQKPTKDDFMEQESLDNLNDFSPVNDTCRISAANLRLAHCWLRNCLETHEPCRSNSQSLQLPRRVVDVRNPQRAFLSISNGIFDEYVTLSYKWGIGPKYQTLKSNYIEHQEKLPIEKLPLTFQEAITVTRFLGFRFLWIDALCIIEDHKQDRRQELNSMDKTFQRSTLTLFAVSGDNVNAGLSIRRNPVSTKPCKMQLKSRFSKGYTEESTWVSLGDWTRSGPLYERGWVLQEEILSRRRLNFQRDQMTWHCFCELSSETKPNYRTVTSLEELLIAKQDQWRENRFEFPGEGPRTHDKLAMWLQLSTQMSNLNHINIYEEWYKMVISYSTRSLTFSSDALPALTGLANAVEMIQSSTYRYGLWEEDLQFGLCWFAESFWSVDLERACRAESHVTHLGGYPVKIYDPNPLPRHGPTWSWSYVCGKKIDFWRRAGDRIDHLGVQLRPEITPGSLNRKQLTLLGRIKPARVDYQKRLLFFDARLVDPETGAKIGDIKFDEDPKPSPQVAITWLLCIATNRDEGVWNQTGLALVPVDNEPDTYRRIGFIDFNDETFFGHLSRSEDIPIGPEHVDGRKYIKKICLV